MTQANFACCSNCSSHSMPSRSRWLVGSSSRRISGAVTRASAMASRLRQPPESDCAWAWKSSKPARPSVSCRRASRSRAGTPEPSSAASITWVTLRPGGKDGLLRNVGQGGALAQSNLARSAGSSPARMRSKVVLPEPFGPIRAIRSRSLTVKLTLRNSGSAPKAFDRDWALRIGGIPSIIPRLAIPSRVRGYRRRSGRRRRGGNGRRPAAIESAGTRICSTVRNSVAMRW